MPRCLPEGDVEVFSGHFLKPSVSFMKSSFCGLALNLLGHHWCFRNCFVALFSGKDSILAVLLITLFAKGVRLSYFSRVLSG